MNKNKRIQELVPLLNKASDAYYNSDKPIMEDPEFDKLFDELKQLEVETGLILSNSPTTNVGFEVKSKLEKVTHSIPLKSLGKTKSINELIKFINRKECITMLKGDGLTTELIYNKGIFEQGSTRGNSIIGEDISHNVKTYKNIPLKIDFKGYLKLAGESVILDKDFELINSKLSEEDKYSNSRNLVAGSVRQLDSSICTKRNVNFYAFTLLECYDENKNKIEFETVEEQFNFLNNLGFTIIDYFKFDLTKADSISTIIEILKKDAKEKGIPIDGLVIKFNNIAYGLSLGETAHHPLNAIALKDQNEEYETEYIRTEWQVSRSGLINPVGIFKPVNIDGADIERATLHNLDYFRSLALGKRDIVTVIRANQVIPKITGNLTRSNSESIPSICPICGSETKEEFMKTASVLYCTNDKCPSRQVAQFSHFVSRNCMNIDGLSEATLEKFISKGFLKRLPDIYSLELYKKEITHMDGFGLKSYNNMINAIENSRKCKLENFLFSLGIPQVGLSTAKLIAKKFKIIQGFIAAKNSEIMSIEGIGDVTTEEILQYRMNNMDLILDLVKEIEFIEEEKKVDNSLKDLTGITFVITGEVHTFKNRDEFKELVQSLGGKVSGSVSKKTNYLVNNDINSTTGKNQKAHELNIPIINEESFNKMIGRIV